MPKRYPPQRIESTSLTERSQSLTSSRSSSLSPPEPYQYSSLPTLETRRPSRWNVGKGKDRPKTQVYKPTFVGRSRPGANRDSDRIIMVAVRDRIDGWRNDFSSG